MHKLDFGSLEVVVAETAKIGEDDERHITMTFKRAETLTEMDDQRRLEQALSERVKITLNEFEGFTTLMTDFGKIEDAVKFLDAGDTKIRQVA